MLTLKAKYNELNVFLNDVDLIINNKFTRASIYKWQLNRVNKIREQCCNHVEGGGWHCTKMNGIHTIEKNV